MTLEDYTTLVNLKFVNYYEGGVNPASWEHTFPWDANRDLVNRILDSQLDEPIDFKNIIILFPLWSGGTNGFFGTKRVLIDHAGFIVYVRRILKEHGVKFKDSNELDADKYSQATYSMLIVHNGMACVSEKIAKPTDPTQFTTHHKIFDGIHVNDSDIPNLNIKGKQIFFSGFFLENIKNNRAGNEK